MSIQNFYYTITSSRSFFIQMVFTLNAIYYVTQADLNALQLILIGTIMEISVLLFEMPTGLYADHFGRKRSLALGTIIIGLAHVIEGSTPEFWAIAFSSAMWGIGWTFISGAEQAWIADELDGTNLETTFLRGSQFSSFARFAGILASVAIAAFWSVQTAIIFAGVMLIALAVWAFIKLPETKFVRVTREKGVSGITHMINTIKVGLSQIRGKTMLVSIAVVTLLWGLASEGFDRLYGAHFITNFDLSEDESIYWFGAFYAIAFILNIGVLHFVEKNVKGRYADVLLLTNAVLTGTMLIFAWTGHFWLAVAMYWVTSALRNVNYPLMSIITNEQIESKGRATTLSMFGQLDAFGQIVGGPLVGLFALYTTIAGGISASAFLILPILYFFWRIKTKMVQS
ncbi:MFS transporter, DHA3 family, tetracycline resistance protein [Paenisporosarcina quisquiliarum]|nr:MFS transporter, DHA3 family, tetracycline resistance protein [Paenisporosarcina quisquiliarum]